ncbi:MAG: DNA polymerase III subunit delta [Gammaproteobacteria bacterium]|nr:DNA polymerase III subunit delta [Gammaproteobacteria bacterium]
MQIYANQLANQLKQLVPCYLVFGDEPLQKKEALSDIRQACDNAGFSERICLSQQPGFSWNELTQAGQNLSLFSSRQLIELELTTIKPGQDGSKALISFIENASPDTILLIHGPKAGQDVQKAKWFKQLSQAGLFVVINQPQGQAFNHWVNRRLSHHRLNLTPDAQAQFSRLFEGNLLAADQELEKLSLQLGQQQIDLATLKQRTTNQARYSLFELQDALLNGSANKALAILNHLKQQAVEPQLIFWAFNKEFELLQQLHQQQQQKQSLAKIYQQARIWQSRQNLYQNALQRLSAQHLLKIAQLLAQIDLEIKINFSLPWPLLTELVLVYSQADTRLLQRW